MKRTLLCALVPALLALPAPAHAQQAQAPLDRIEAMVARGSYAEARSTLEQWWKSASGGDKAPAPLKARGLSLRARLSTDPRAAEQDYLAIALGYPTAPEAPGALLALGQLLYTLGELPRAETYLARLAADYPRRPERPAALLWLARTRIAAGKGESACAAVRDALSAAPDPELAGLLQTEQSAACATPSATAERAPEQKEPPAASRFTVQLGAFQSAQSARALANRLSKAGFTPRTAFVPGSSLRRVRVGTFHTAAEAEATLRKLRAAGFDGAVASDAHSERPAP
jgi:cell division septation protein DedD